MKGRRWAFSFGGLSATILLSAMLLAGCSNEAEPEKPKYEGEFKEFDLWLVPLTNSSLGDQRLNLYQGNKVEAWGFSPDNDPTHATIPGPEIRVREGDTVSVTLHVPPGLMAHTVHWHGIHVPWNMDGVPYVSQQPIGEKAFGGSGASTFTYEFNVTAQSGTYWYHCHVDTQHHTDMGMYGPLIVEPADPEQDPAYDVEETLMFDEWDKSHIHSGIQPDQIRDASGDPMLQEKAVEGQVQDYYHMGALNTVERTYAQQWGTVNKTNPALADQLPTYVARKNRTWYPVTYPAYFAEYDTFLINGHAFPDTKVVKITTGQTLRLRLINAGNLVHSIHLHGHHMLVTHTDGYPLASPYYKDTILIAPGERYDVYVKGDNPGGWMLHDHMSQYEQNDHIAPGGMSTILCYTDGWPMSAECDAGRHPDAHGPHTAGSVLATTARFLRATQGGDWDPAFHG